MSGEGDFKLTRHPPRRRAFVEGSKRLMRKIIKGPTPKQMAAIASSNDHGAKNGKAVDKGPTIVPNTLIHPFSEWSEQKLSDAQKNRRGGMPIFFSSAEGTASYSAAEHLTSPVALPLLKHAGLLDGIPGPVRVLDLACGTGVVGHLLQDHLKKEGPLAQEKVHMTCSDISPTQVDWVRRRAIREKWINVDTTVADASRCILPTEAYDVVTIAMALMLIPDPRNTLKECRRMLLPGGKLAFSTWLVEGWVSDTARAISEARLPGNPAWPRDSDELVAAWALGPWHDEVFVKNMLRAADFEDVETERVKRTIVLRDADHFCHVFRAFVRAVTDDYWTAGQRAECLPYVQPAFKKFLEKKYGVGKPISVERTVILASGRKPEKH